MTYDDVFYDTIRAGCRASAEIVVPLIHSVVQPATVIDVGCGEGWWGAAFAALGATVTGLDGGYVRDRAIPFLETDLNEPLPALGPFDLAVCLEVAEHLPENRGASLVADLCSLAPVILFSAAIPGQPGAGHINCQWPTWWATLFAAQGFCVSGAIRDRIWDDERIEPWYRQNLLVAARTPMTPWFPDPSPVDRTHPVIASWM